MSRRNSIIISLVGLLGGFYPALSWATSAQAILDDIVLPNVSIQAQSDNTTIISSPSDEIIIPVEQIIGLSDNTTVTPAPTIEFIGSHVPPHTTIQLRLTNGLRYQVTAGDTGDWNITIPVVNLPVGKDHAYLQVQTSDGTSKEVEVAEFIVEDKTMLSTSTWIFLISTLAAIISLLLAITLQLRHNMRVTSARSLF